MTTSDDELCDRAMCAELPAHPRVISCSLDVPMPREGVDLDEYAKRIVEHAPPLSASQKRRLAAILRRDV